MAAATPPKKLPGFFQTRTVGGFVPTQVAVLVLPLLSLLFYSDALCKVDHIIQRMGDARSYQNAPYVIETISDFIMEFAIPVSHIIASISLLIGVALDRPSLMVPAIYTYSQHVLFSTLETVAEGLDMWGRESFLFYKTIPKIFLNFALLHLIVVTYWYQVELRERLSRGSADGEDLPKKTVVHEGDYHIVTEKPAKSDDLPEKLPLP